MVDKRERIPRGQSKIIIQRNWQYRVHKDEEKQNKNTTKNINKTNNLLSSKPVFILCISNDWTGILATLYLFKL